jgi:hypothetical protein
MALRVEVSGYGICKTQMPHAVFIICVQQEKFEAWTVYRRFQNFLLLRDQLIGHHPAVPALPAIDHNNFQTDYLEYVRSFLDRWLQSLTCNTYILRMQAMYQFLCIDANMPPPYLDIYFMNNSSNSNGNGSYDDEMDMNEMFEEGENGNADDDYNRPSDMNDEDSHIRGHHGQPQEISIFDFEHQKRSPSNKSPRMAGNGKKRPSNPMIDPPPIAISGYGEGVMTEMNDAKDGMDIQSLSYVQAEFIYDKKDNDNKIPPSETAAQHRTISLEAFKIIKVIGKGSFGKVFLVRDKASNTIYAMKVLKKDYIKKKNQIEHTRTERSVLGSVSHPFIVGLNMAFQTADKLFFVLDYCSGGELFFHLGKVGRFPEERAKFYAGQIILALEYVHKMGIIYR